MATIPLPNHNFDPTETGVPWRSLSQRGHRILFDPPDSKVARADLPMITGKDLECSRR